MKKENDFYTVSREDYLIAVYLLKKEKGTVRSVDVSEMLGYKKPSISVGIHRLIEAKLLYMDEGYFLNFTEEGQRKAEEIYHRYKIVKDFLQLILGVEEQTAEMDSHRIEHLISKETVEQLAVYLKKEKIFVK